MKIVAIIGILATSIMSFGASLDLCERSSPSAEFVASHPVDLLDKFI
ncbi:MAG: hypothetical protein ACKOB7_09615 [Methylocystis sp.]